MSTAATGEAEGEAEEAAAAPTAPAKIKVHFRSVGQAPVMKKNKFMIQSTQPFSTLAAFLRKPVSRQTLLRLLAPELTAISSCGRILRLSPSDPLFLYCNDSFSPTLDQSLATLHACFGLNDELVVNYGVTEAWG